MQTKPASDFSSSFAEKLPYLPSLARYDTSPDLWHVLHRRKLSQMVSKRPVHTGMSLKGQTNWGLGTRD